MATFICKIKLNYIKLRISVTILSRPPESLRSILFGDSLVFRCVSVVSAAYVAMLADNKCHLSNFKFWCSNVGPNCDEVKSTIMCSWSFPENL